MFAYTDALASVTAGFPGSIFSPHDFRNQDDSPGISVTNESGTVPASPYKINLNYVPLEQATTTITVAGVEMVKIPWGQTPSAGQVAISLDSGALQFHAAQTGGAILATYTGRGTPVASHLLNEIGREIEAIETILDAKRERVVRFLPGAAVVTGAGEWVGKVSFDSTLLTEVQVTRITLDAPAPYAGGMPPTGTTTIQIDKSTAFSSPTSVSLGVSDTDAAQTATLTIDVSGGEAIYIRVSAAGGHENLFVTLEIKTTGVA